MPTNVTNYQCPACTGALHFSSATGRLECEYCGSAFPVEEIEAMYAQKEAEAKTATPDEWDMSGLGSDWGEDAAGMRAYNCPSCGAQLLCDATTAATSCPYCGNPTIVPGQFQGALKPDYVIPFKQSKDAAIAALKAHYKGKFFLPKVFSDENHIQEIKGIYVPFWLFNTSADADLTFAATKVHTRISGSYEITTTEHYHVRRAGTMRFLKIPADGSSKMPDDYMDSIEPFHYNELRDFSTAYLPGYLADKYDVSAESCAGRIGTRVRTTVQELMRNDVRGYTTVRQRGGDVRVKKGTVQYAMLPVWMLNTKWNEKNYLFAMNGQTGKLVGDLPVDMKKFYLTLLALTVAIAAFLLFTGISGGIGRWIGLLLA